MQLSIEQFHGIFVAGKLAKMQKLFYVRASIEFKPKWPVL